MLKLHETILLSVGYAQGRLKSSANYGGNSHSGKIEQGCEYLVTVESTFFTRNEAPGSFEHEPLLFEGRKR